MTTEPLLPVMPEERVESIDILRGLALIGILAANIRGFAGPAATYFSPHLFWPELHDQIAQAFIETFVQGKFITIFAFLFGVGFAVQLERAEARGTRFTWVYVRRLLLLLVFGLVHGLLIWFGDILLVYALIGLVLLAFRRRRDKTLLIWGVITYLVPLLFVGAAVVASLVGAPIAFPEPTPAAIATLRETFSSGTWLQIQQQRMIDAVASNWGFFPMMMWQVLALFLFGMLVWRRRLLQPSAEMLPRYRRAMMWGFAIGIAGNLSATILRWLLDLSAMSMGPMGAVATVLQMAGTPALSLGYICLTLLLCNDPAWLPRLQPFGAVGRMALTNYLLQSVIGTLIFYSYGLGFFGRIGPAWLLLLTIAIYVVQIAISVWWLARFRFGPVEWLWRSLTYGRSLPLAR